MVRRMSVMRVESAVKVFGLARQRHLLFPLLFCFFGCCLTLQRGSAASPEDQQRLLAATLREPANYELLFEYVKVSEDLFDYEAAISALERALFYDPGQTRVQFELGVLYFRLGSHENALHYFEAAAASPDLDPSLRPRLEAFIFDATRELHQSRLYGFFQTGLGYQSNAAALPNSGFVRVLGINLPLGATPQKADGNGFGIVRLNHDYDFQNQRGDVLETRFYGYGTEQMTVSRYNFGFVDASIGPRFGLAPGYSIKPYVAGSMSWIGGSQFLNSGGGGISLRIQPPSVWSFEPAIEWRHLSVSSPGFGQISALGNGDLYTISFSGSYKFSETLTLEARPIFARAAAVNPWQSFDQEGFDAGLHIEFAGPFASVPVFWSVVPYASVLWSSFDAADPSVDNNTVRRDFEYRAGLLVDLPMATNFGFSGMVQYERTNSNLPNFRIDDLSVMFGPTARF
jgi:hypothetical protein